MLNRIEENITVLEIVTEPTTDQSKLLSAKELLKRARVDREALYEALAEAKKKVFNPSLESKPRTEHLTSKFRDSAVSRGSERSSQVIPMEIQLQNAPIKYTTLENVEASTQISLHPTAQTVLYVD